MQSDPLVIEDVSSNLHIPYAGIAQESPEDHKRNSSAEPIHVIEGPKCFLMMKTSESAKIRIKVNV
jgi:hypothetical protein